jgi:hypothetical protein
MGRDIADLSRRWDTGLQQGLDTLSIGVSHGALQSMAYEQMKKRLSSYTGESQKELTNLGIT